ncbi:prosaposin receptor GPR37L1 [Silurus asotus]|uniref:Prosaposin receptor GPR37L1 n=1 Tax=Silurus asotus TaxID=30991 RepID=A0AAD4ZZQ3_SILAS|nr:prosaposin receptor GPR37L1 [Silurus asotus]
MVYSRFQWSPPDTPSHDPVAVSPTLLSATSGLTYDTGVYGESAIIAPGGQHRRMARSSKDKSLKQRAEHHKHPHPRPFDPDSYFTTPRVFNGSLLVHNPLYPVTGDSYGAYAVMLLALVVFAVGVVANLAVTCAVWHNHYQQNARTCVLASLALWDLAVIFFCLPVVIFHELTKRRLMGDVSCRLVPFIEVTSLGVNTFSLCALSVDRFQTLTSTSSSSKTPESFGSILSKLSVIWVGSLLLAIPELMIWRLETELSHVSRLPVDSCIRLPPSSPHFSESVYSLIMTYHESRMWWLFGCFFCLPLLFSFSCHLLMSQISDSTTSMSASCSASSYSSLSKKIVMVLAIVYGVFCLPEHAWNIGLTYAGVAVGGGTLALLALIGQFLMFVRASATPILILSLCRTLGQSFLDCCCCCCEECLPSKPSSLSLASSTSSSSSPVLKKEKKLQMELEKKMRENSVEMAIGTPC